MALPRRSTLLLPEWTDRSNDGKIIGSLLQSARARGTDTSHLSTGHFARLWEVLTPEQGSAPHLWVAMMYSWWQWSEAGRVVLRLDEDLTRLLMSTPLPKGPIDPLPSLPWNGFYLVPAPLFSLTHKDTGAHLIEGTYISTDRSRVSQTAEAGPTIFTLSAGDDRLKGADPARRDDCLQYAALHQGHPIRSGRDEFPGLEDALRVAVNFLLLWNSASRAELEMEKREEPSSPTHLSAKKRRRWDRQNVGRSTLPYFQLGLKCRAKSHRTGTTDSEATHEVLLGRFWRDHWMLEENVPDGVQVVKTGRVSQTGKPMVAVNKLIEPHRAWRHGRSRELREMRVKKV